MTAPLAEQSPPREPGYYWVYIGDKWRPAEWTPSRFLKGGYWHVAGYGAGGRGLLVEELAEIGPRIPDVATLQQQERLVAELDATKVILEEEEAAHQDTLRLWQEVKAKHERANAVVEAAIRFRDDATGSNETLNALWDAINGATGDTK